MTGLCALRLLARGGRCKPRSERCGDLAAGTLPIIRPSLVAGFTFCFVLSFVNLPLSLFITDARTATLPIVMFSYIELRIDPMIAAVSTVIVALAAVTTLLLESVLRIRLVD